MKVAASVTRFCVVAAACAGLLLGTAAMAQAKPGLDLGFADPLFEGAERDSWLTQARSLGAGSVKVFVSWDETVGNEPANPRNPADPAYSFGQLDPTVTAAKARGLDVLLGVQAAPSWAEGAGKPGSAGDGTWKPSPAKFEDYMAALARRYSGSFQGLPRVRDFQIWNEPNIDTYLAPQWTGKKQYAAGQYKKLLAAGSRGIESVSRANRVVAAGLAPYGEPPGGSRTRPVSFWQKVLCLKGSFEKKKGCKGKAKIDVFAHNAINTSGPPHQKALSKKDASSGDLKKLARLFRASEKARTVTGRKHPRWVTEFWWDSNPPSKSGVSLAKQARYTSELLYLAWSAGFDRAVQLRIRDDPSSNVGPGTRTGDGLFFADGTAKPSAAAYRFPFVADRKNKKKVKLWGKAPKKGKVVIERKRGKRWKRVKKLKAGGNHIFKGKARLKGHAKLRARAGRTKSVTWKLK